MRRLSTRTGSNALYASLLVALLGICLTQGPSVWAVERDPLTLRVVAVNPSEDKMQTVPIRIDLPQEISPKEILEQGDLSVEFDTERSSYYVYKEGVELAPKQVKAFEVVVKDVWFIPGQDLEALRTHTKLLLDRLTESDYAQPAQQLGNSILARLDEIERTQSDETLSSKQHIGAYRRNQQALQVIKEDLERMEKLLSFTGGIPVPEMLEESPLKSDAPSKTTTWLVIFLILIFMGLLAGQFFFTWHRRVKAIGDFGLERQEAFPEPGATSESPAGTTAGESS